MQLGGVASKNVLRLWRRAREVVGGALDAPVDDAQLVAQLIRLARVHLGQRRGARGERECTGTARFVAARDCDVRVALKGAGIRPQLRCSKRALAGAFITSTVARRRAESVQEDARALRVLGVQRAVQPMTRVCLRRLELVATSLHRPSAPARAKLRSRAWARRPVSQVTVKGVVLPSDSIE